MWQYRGNLYYITVIKFILLVFNQKKRYKNKNINTLCDSLQWFINIHKYFLKMVMSHVDHWFHPNPYKAFWISTAFLGGNMILESWKMFSSRSSALSPCQPKRIRFEKVSINWKLARRFTWYLKQTFSNCNAVLSASIWISLHSFRHFILKALAEM